MKKALLKLFDSHEECLIKFERANDFIEKKTAINLQIITNNI